jgi:hypothetical protein
MHGTHAIELSGAAAVCRVRSSEGLGGAKPHGKATSVADPVAAMDDGPRLVRIRGVLRKESRRLSARLAVQVANRADLATVHRQMYGLVIPQWIR